MNTNRIIEEFKKSNKKNIVITGKRGIGKTTLAKKFVDENTYIIRTEAIIGEQQRTKLRKNIIEQTNNKIENLEQYLQRPNSIIMMDVTENKTITIAVRKENCMQANITNLEGLGIEILKNAIKSDCEEVLIDEIGFIECKSKKYQNNLMDLFDEKAVIAVLRKMQNDLFEMLINREDVFVIDLD